ncbi:RnfABCDGE type electron transport complex subunit D [Desulfosarcina sp. OttesenSCG-928-A07]|nr:RnfABCDGE type electron transport complex subunit D [Desulfosarcina sp. OttesenSCG-928-G17]MDL2329721.1 RnfABCDGE type electron transport complex subunit D [Desulfosarcina sp. OttesenSCG-928-A07]
MNVKSSMKPASSAISVSPSPHLANTADSTRRMMLDVLIALAPVVGMSIYIFRLYAVFQLVVCLCGCLLAEFVFVRMRGRKPTLMDGSAVVTAVILAMSLPGTAPWYVGFIAAFVAIGIGKIIFGGLGMNIFNPAMVGRAFVMIAFAGVMAASGYEIAGSTVDVVSQATPMNAYKMNGVVTPLINLFWGNTNGSLGETSALACLLGGLYLVIRRTASWEIPAGVILAVLVIGALDSSGTGWTALHHLFGGAVLFGAFFIATDPVTSPLTPKGKFIFGLGTGVLIMVLRLFSGYPEGLMFAVLFMNALTPLINRWTIPTPFGGKKQ